MSRPRRYGGPAAQLPRSILEALVGEDRLPEALEGAWWRIVRTFASAKTRNCISGCDGQVGSLAKHILGKMSDEARAAIFPVDRLPDGYGMYLKGTPTEVVDRIIYDLLVQKLVELRDDKRQYVWYQSGDWCIAPGAMSLYDKSARRVIPDPRGRSDYRKFGGVIPKPPRVIMREIMAAGTVS